MLDPPKVGGELAPSTTDIGETRGGFEGLLEGAVGQVQSLQKDTQDKVRSMMLGEGAELHDVMIAANKSDTTRTRSQSLNSVVTWASESSAYNCASARRSRWPAAESLDPARAGCTRAGTPRRIRRW